MHQNRHIFKFCRKILRTIFLTILVNLGSNGHLWIETLGIETIFAQLRHILIRRTQLYQNQLFPGNMRQNQAFLATVYRDQHTSLFNVAFRSSKFTIREAETSSLLSASYFLKNVCILELISFDVLSSTSYKVNEQHAKQASSRAIIIVKSCSIVKGNWRRARHFELKWKNIIR